MAHPTGLRLTDYAKNYPWPQHTAMRIRTAAGRTGDLTDLRGDPIWQADEGECTGAAPRMALRIYTKFRGIEMPDVSDQALYTLGRLQEWAGLNPDLEPDLIDNGADPAWVLTAAQNVGLIFARDWPGPGDAGHDVSKRNTEPPRELLTSAWARRGLLFHQVTWAAGTLREQVDQLHRGGHPVLGVFCADGIQTNPGAAIVRKLPSPRFANHIVTCLDSTDAVAGRWDNWWRRDSEGIYWGDPSDDPGKRGTWLLDWEAAEAGMALILTIDFLPPPNGDAA